MLHAHSYAQSRNETSYDITATLNAKTHEINGHVQLRYVNHSADTLRYLWIRLVPNAFKNDKTAFSEYLLEKGTSDFYFAKQSERGYINRIDFKTGNVALITEDHPSHIDLIKVYLDEPLDPSAAVDLSTPFHVKLPYNFDGIGYSKQGYHLKYWYPVVALYSDARSGSMQWDDSPFTTKDVRLQRGGYTLKLSAPSNFDVRSNAQLLDSVKDGPVTIQTFSSPALSSLDLEITRRGYVEKEKQNTRLKERLCDATVYLQQKRLLPSAGYNFYDGLQAGILVKNIKENNQINYYAAPLYGTESKRLTGVAGVSMKITAPEKFEHLRAGIQVAGFSTREGLNIDQQKVFGHVLKIVPSINFSFKTKHRHLQNNFDYRFFYLQETELNYVMSPRDSNYYPQTSGTGARYVNQLTYTHSNKRVLYPYSAQLQLQQGEQFFRINAEGKYFFNYAKGGGLSIRAFASKFGYLGTLSQTDRFLSRRFQPKLTAVNGDEDFTYSNYFIRRNNANVTGGQIMLRDGDLKLKTDLFDGLQGRSDNWVASANFNTTLPQITPLALPIRLFCDVGTYSDAWISESGNARFLYVAGLQLSLLKDVVNIYVPVIYSKTFRDRLKTIEDESKFFGKLTFSVNLNKLQFAEPLCDQLF